MGPLTHARIPAYPAVSPLPLLHLTNHPNIAPFPYPTHSPTPPRPPSPFPLTHTPRSSARRTGDFSCLKFVPPCLGLVRHLAAQPERPRHLSWPRLAGEVARRASAAQQLVRSWAAGGGTDPRVLSAHGPAAMMLVRADGVASVSCHSCIPYF